MSSELHSNEVYHSVELLLFVSSFFLLSISKSPLNFKIHKNGTNRNESQHELGQRPAAANDLDPYPQSTLSPC